MDRSRLAWAFFVARTALWTSSLVACTPTATPAHSQTTPAAAHAQATPATARAQAPAVAPRPYRQLPAAGDGPGVAVGTHGAVASAESHASQVGLDVLKAGGNAVDAAIAVAFALAVTHPSAGNLGGGGFMLLRTAAGESVAIDYRETAPLAASRDMYLDEHGEMTKASVLGARAAGIPGTVAGLELAHARFGTKPWAELLAPAIALARDGHALEANHAQDMAEAVEKMRAAGFESSARVYLSARGAPIAAGEVWKQPDLARTLAEISVTARAFYQGPLAERIVKQMQAQAGLWTLQDLSEYRALTRTPLRFSYLGHEVITMPPPSAGGIVMRQILFASELLGFRKYPYRSAQAFHLYAEATRRAYADRNVWLGDPDFVKIPVAGLLDPAYMTARMQTIDPAHATPSSQVSAGAPRQESPQTTHFSVIDDAGNAVSNTFTLNTGFGAKLVLEGTGILLNNEMDDFAGNPGKPNAYGLVQGERNKIEPKKRMLSSMTPTLLLKNGMLRAVLGTPGGPTITTTVVQLVRALVDYGVTLDVAVRAARVHHQWLPDNVVVESTIEPEIVTGLEALGHKVMTLEAFGHKGSAWTHIGHADCIEVDPTTLGYRAVADVTRGGGGALAY
jgi:gamma-glutamyltranspeptidase/glutathione hydrolase